MCAQEVDWQMACDRETFEKCRHDEEFPYIVALARAVNTLTFIHSAMKYPVSDNSPAAMRGRLNSYLFGSAIMYEALQLIKNMGRVFVDDELYQNGLRLILKDDIAKNIEHLHLKPARHGAVFHFDVTAFKETIDKALSNQCLFVSARGRSRMGTSYSYANIVSAEILVGFPAGGRDFERALGNAMQNTSDLVTKFADQAEPLIASHLGRWGFVITSQPVPTVPASPENQS
ncbi:MAG: hypothetical protein ABSF90_32175 [Syntrophobacteraceae bacterium]|jgi:hypothetical protein